MKRFLAGLTLAGAILAPLGSASAQFAQSWSPFCIGNSTLGFCAKGSFGFDNAGHVTFTVTNLSDGGAVYGGSTTSAFNNLGLFNLAGTLGVPTNFLAMDGSTNVTSSWDLTNSSANGTTANLQLTFDANTQGNDKAPLLSGHTIVFTFDATGLQTNGADVYIKSQSPVGSIECLTNSTQNGLAACVPVTSTPEPASLALLGTGLVGIYGAFRRRRNAA